MLPTRPNNHEPSKSLFRNLEEEDQESEMPTEIESLCLACSKNGTTKLLLIKIPFYKEIILMSFECPHCGCTNNETQFGGKFQENGIKIRVKVQNAGDLNRQVVRSDFAVVSIPELEFEIPSMARKGEVTTIEGILSRTLTSLEAGQSRRKQIDPVGAARIDEFLEKLRQCIVLQSSFHFVLEDPSGNSFVENLFAPQKDEAMEVKNYKRNREEDRHLGIFEEDGWNGEDLTKIDENLPVNTADEVMQFATNCSNCNAPCETNMKMTQIPHFKEVVIMATNCDMCGHRTNEVKAGSGIEPLGLKITLRILNPMDLSRDVLKSETCSVAIPDLDFEMGAGALGGRFTTIEGLLENVKDQLLIRNPFLKGDSVRNDFADKMKEFGKKLDEIISCERKVKMVFDDPAGNSYVQNVYAPEPDPEMEVIKYERTFEQNEELGLNDMKTENY